MIRIHQFGAALLAPALTVGALAEPTSSEIAAANLTLKEKIEIAAVDMPVGVSPASFLLGASGENVPRLAAFRQFFMQAGRAYNEKGEIAKAVAVEVAPALATGGLAWTDIERSFATKAWARTTVSMATTVKSDKDPAKAAIGLQTILYAPAMDLAVERFRAGNLCSVIATDFITQSERAQALQQEAEKLRKDGRERQAKVKQAEADALLKDTIDRPEQNKDTVDRAVLAEKVTACEKEVRDILTKWNQSLVVFGAGHVSPSGDTTQKSSNAMWISGAYGFSVKDQSDKDVRDALGGLLTAHARHNQRVAVKDTADVEAIARQRLFGLNLRIGNGRDAVLAEYSIAKYSATGHAFNDRKRSLIAYERRLQPDLYISVGFAHDSGAPKSQQAVLARIQWNFSDKPPFTVGNGK